MLTQIFSCSAEGKGYTIDDMDYLNLVWFPEIKYTHGGAAPMPVHPVEQIKAAYCLIGKTIITLSEHIILWFLREVREGRMALNDVELFCDGQRIRIDSDGKLVDKWPGGFFRERANLLF